MLVVLAVFIVATIAEPVAMFLVLAFGYAASPLIRGFRGLGRRLVRTGAHQPERVSLRRAGPPGSRDGSGDGG